MPLGPRRSVAARLLITQAVALVMLLGVIGFLAYRHILEGMRAQVRQSARSLLINLQEMITEDPSVFTDDVLQPVVLRTQAKIADVARLSIVDRSLHIIADSDPRLVGTTTDQIALVELLRNPGETAVSYVEQRRPYYRLSRSVRGPYDPARKSSTIGVLSIDMDLSGADARTRSTFLGGMAALSTFLVALGLFQYLRLRRSLVDPLRETVLAVEAFGSGDVARRAPVRTMDEVGQLADAFNRMAESLVASGDELRLANSKLELELAVRRRAEQELRRNEERYRSVMESASDAVVSADRHGRILFFNRAAERVFGYRAAEVGGSPLSLLMPERLREAHQRGFQHFLATREPRVIGKTVELVGRSKDGREFPIEMSLATWNVDGEQFFTAMMRDITDRKHAEEELKGAREAALEASRLKSEFLASMSHEIRTPLNGVIGMTGLLLDTELSPQQRDYAHTTRSSAEHLLGIINDVLDFSKIEAGQLTLEPIPFELRSTVEEVVEIVGPRAAEKKLELVIRITPEIHRRVIGDPGRIRQILTNLAGNAIKFTPTGHVLIDVDVQRATDGEIALRFAVEDSGIGIADDKLEHIFDRFAQADASTTRKYGGSGLGLAISKQLVELMQGEIGVNSRVGRGSTFWFTITLPLDPEGGEALVVPPALRDVRVLVVDDNAISRRVLREQLDAWKIRNDGAASAEEALAELQQADAARDAFAIAIIDRGMPGTDGLTLGRKIKADPRLCATVLILLTSSTRPAHADAAVETGFGASLRKPARPARLLEALESTWNTRRGTVPRAISVKAARAGAAAPAKPETKPSTGRVLLVDDNVVNQKVGILMLEQLGCRVDVAADGKEAVEMVFAFPYDVVFMDCQMPEMDGYEATRTIRAREEDGRRIPIIAMTAHAMQGDREKCLEAGMDEYIRKPVKPTELKRALERWIAEGTRNRDAVAAARVSGAVEAAPETASSAPDAGASTAGIAPAASAGDAAPVSDGGAAAASAGVAAPASDGGAPAASASRAEASTGRAAASARAGHSRRRAAATDAQQSAPNRQSEGERMTDESSRQTNPASAAADAAQPSGADQANGGNATAAMAGDSLPVDLTGLMDLVGDDTETLGAVVEAYLKTTLELTAKLRAAIEAGSAVEIGRIAHNGAGSSATMCINGIVPMFRALEAACREERLADVPRLAEAIDGEFARIQAFFKEHAGIDATT